MNRVISVSERREVESPTVSKAGEYVASAPRASFLAGSKLIVNAKTDTSVILLINIGRCLLLFIWQRLIMAKVIRFFLICSIR